jgi:hypothetical protein
MSTISKPSFFKFQIPLEIAQDPRVDVDRYVIQEKSGKIGWILALEKISPKIWAIYARSYKKLPEVNNRPICTKAKIPQIW